MARAGWFLEKKGRFYGPFSPEKVRAFEKAGKIGPQSMIAEDREGSFAKPLAEIWDQIEDPPARDPSEASARTAGRDWMVITPGRSFGPYPIEHLADLLRDGKLKPDDLVRRGDEAPVPVSSVVPSDSAPPLRAATPAEEPEHIPRRLPPPDPDRDKGRKRLGALVMLVLVVGIGSLWFFMFRGDIALEDTTIGDTLVEGSKLHQMIREAEIPPFNAMARQALRVGLNFPARDIRAYHAADIDARTLTSPDPEVEHRMRDKMTPRYWRAFFGGDITEVLRYQTDGQLIYTYLIGSDGLAFAVAIEGPTFSRQKLETYQLDDFAPATRVGPEINEHVVWTSEIAAGILARAFWQQERKGRRLHFICVMNDPDLGQEG